MAIPNLNRVFQPSAIAVIGASSRPGAVGNTVLSNLLKADYRGALYPVNPKRTNVLGLKAFPDVAVIPECPDLAVVCTPAASTPEILRACGQAGVGGVVVISAGFREAGRAGLEIETQLRAEASRWPEMRVIGPNCLGVLSPRARLNASFAPAMPLDGHIALISQSGALCASILDWSLSANVGFSHFVSIGNSIDVEFSDLISYFAEDPHTSSVVLYIESINKAREFIGAARAFTRVKPIVAYKAGRNAASARAAASHTGAMAGIDAVYDVAFRRAGVIRVDAAADLFDCARLLAARRMPRGPRLAIVTNAGGPGVMATDSLVERGGELAELSATTKRRLEAAMPPQSATGNPVDVLGDADPERFAHAVATVLDDPKVDAVLCILTPQAMTDPTVTAKRVAALDARAFKPVAGVWMGGEAVREGRQVLAAAGVATFDSPDRGVRAITYLSRRFQSPDRREGSSDAILSDSPRPFAIDRHAARAYIDQRTCGAVDMLSETQAKGLLAAYGLRTITPYLAQSSSEAMAIGRQIGFPVVMKIQSPDITHKSDVHGVQVGVSDSLSAREAFERIMDSVRRRIPDARIDGVTVQSMVSCPEAIEIILGAKRDPAFGPIVLVGAGGVTAELSADRALELPPLSGRRAREMLQSLRMWPLLSGFRGRPAVDVDGLIDALVRLSYLVVENRELRELEANPVLATPSEIVVLDARAVLECPVGEGASISSLSPQLPANC